MVSTEELLAHVGLFERATPAELALVASKSYVKAIARGQVLFSEGEPGDHLFVVAAGRVKVTVGSERGERLTLAVLKPGDSLGEMSVLDGSPRSATVEALDDARLVCVPSMVWLNLLQTSPAVCLALAEDLAARVRSLSNNAANLVFLDLPRRLANLLVTSSSSSGEVLFSQAEVAEQLGVTRPSLNRALSGLVRRQWVEVMRGRVIILEPAALAAFAQS